MPPPHVHMGTTLSNPRSLTSNLRPPPSALDPSSLLSPLSSRSPFPSPLAPRPTRAPSSAAPPPIPIFPLPTPNPDSPRVAAGGSWRSWRAGGSQWWVVALVFTYCVQPSLRRSVNSQHLCRSENAGRKNHARRHALGGLRAMADPTPGEQEPCMQGARRKAAKPEKEPANGEPASAGSRWTVDNRTHVCIMQFCSLQSACLPILHFESGLVVWSYISIYICIYIHHTSLYIYTLFETCKYDARGLETGVAWTHGAQINISTVHCPRPYVAKLP